MSNTLFAALALLVPLRSLFSSHGTAVAPARMVATPVSGHQPARAPFSWPAEHQTGQRRNRTPHLRRAHAPLRVVRIVDSQATAAFGGRLLISGRMDDVCAELDRLAEREAALELRAGTGVTNPDAHRAA